MFDYLSYNLIAQNILLCKESWNRKNNKKKVHGLPSPPFFEM
jgi:hypothetical protein